MKKILCLSAVTLTFLLQGVSFANASQDNLLISDEDFAQLVCGHLEGMDDKSEALEEIEAMTESVINDRQLATLEELEESDWATENFCGSYSS